MTGPHPPRSATLGSREEPSIFDAHDRALPDEPTFTLLARDASAPGMVRQWAYEREREVVRGAHDAVDHAMVMEARRIATAMELWRAATEPKRWRDAQQTAFEFVR